MGPRATEFGLRPYRIEKMPSLARCLPLHKTPIVTCSCACSARKDFNLIISELGPTYKQKGPARLSWPIF